jgi:hypothetical protein
MNVAEAGAMASRSAQYANSGYSNASLPQYPTIGRRVGVRFDSQSAPGVSVKEVAQDRGVDPGLADRGWIGNLEFPVDFRI